MDASGACTGENIPDIPFIIKYEPNTRRKITPEEARMLEIKVTINKGSTEALIELIYKVLMEAMKNMSPEQIQSTLFGIAGIVMAGVCLLGIGSKAVAEAFKTKNQTGSVSRRDEPYIFNFTSSYLFALKNAFANPGGVIALKAALLSGCLEI